MHLLLEAAVSPQDKAVEEDECQELDNEVHQPAGPLLAEADEPVAVPDSLLLLQGLGMCQPLQAVTHTQEGGNELHHPDHTALQAPSMCASRKERKVYDVRLSKHGVRHD